MEEITFKRELITPTRANELLSVNIQNNRPINKSAVNLYASEMLAGRWNENTGATIVVSDTGKLLDGQTRMQAIRVSGVSLFMTVCYGVSENSIMQIDQGRLRSKGDSLAFFGVKYAKVIAGGVTVYSLLKKGVSALSGGVVQNSGGFKAGGRAGDNKLSSQFVYDTYISQQNWWDNKVKKSSEKLVDTPSNVLGIWRWFADIDADDADNFFGKLLSGEGLTKNDAIFTLRERLLKAVAYREFALTALERRNMYVRAWNAYRNGEKLARLTTNYPSEMKPI